MTGQYSSEVGDVRAFGQDSDAETKETNLDFLVAPSEWE